jgi:hypothetical protein
MSCPVKLAVGGEWFKLAMEQAYQNSSLCCFARDVTDPRYWGQYANKGCGMALVFDFSHHWNVAIGPDVKPRPTVPFRVDYSDDRPIVQLEWTERGNAWEETRAALLTKHSRWRDQSEFRVIRLGVPAGHVNFPAQSLRAVVLGHSVKPEVAKEIAALIELRADPLPLFRAIRSPTKSAFDIQRYWAS